MKYPAAQNPGRSSRPGLPPFPGDSHPAEMPPHHQHPEGIDIRRPGRCGSDGAPSAVPRPGNWHRPWVLTRSEPSMNLILIRQMRPEGTCCSSALPEQTEWVQRFPGSWPWGQQTFNWRDSGSTNRPDVLFFVARIPILRETLSPCCTPLPGRGATRPPLRFPTTGATATWSSVMARTGLRAPGR